MKYTVVVADDEEEIRRSLVRRVKWEEIGFEVVGEAENGADALELVEAGTRSAPYRYQDAIFIGD